jgi:phosphoribosylanthranilate isomerase
VTGGAARAGAFDGASARRGGAPHVKVCGITRVEDAIAAAASGASAIGFVLWGRSPRAVTIDAARAIATKAGAGVLRVGVFVNALPDVVRRAAAQIPLDVVQLHGDEPIEWADRFTRPVIKVVRTPVADDEPWLTAPVGQVTLLVDAVDPSRRGGTGERADWGEAARLASRRPLVLAGGLTPANVAQAITLVRPYAVDVSSGVEVAPGVKDAAKIAAFVDAVRTAGERAPSTPSGGR